MKINICADVLQDLLEAVEAAIQAGDWKVDGACDPDLAIRRAKETLARPEQDRTWVGLTDAEMAEIWENSGWYVSMFF